MFEDLEIDSIDVVDLMDHVRRFTGRKVTAEDFRAVRTVGDLTHVCSACRLPADVSIMSAAGASSRFSACAVIPVFNHERAIAAVVDGVAAHDLRIFLVDDGCSETCASELRRLSARSDVTLLRHDRNRGKGVAVVTGMRAALGQGYSHALQVDADGQHTLTDIRHFIDEAQSHPDSVICGRPVFDASIPKFATTVRYLTHGMVWFETLSLEIRDSMCGFRLYPLKLTAPLLAPGKSVRAWTSTPRSSCACTGVAFRRAGSTRT